MSAIRIFILTSLTMLAFAGNSVLCRLALKHTNIDAASFTSIRLISGAVVLWLIVSFFRRDTAGKGNWISAFALFAYAAGFSFAYISLTAATGALLLFGAVQATMISYGLFNGERFNKQQLHRPDIFIGRANWSVASRAVCTPTGWFGIDVNRGHCVGCLFIAWEKRRGSYTGHGGEFPTGYTVHCDTECGIYLKH